jgi:hypothetical protein
MQRTDYSAYAGQPVPEFSYLHIYNWQRTSDRSLAVWTKPSQAYLLTLQGPCLPMAGETSIHIGGVDNLEQRLVAGQGEVVVGSLHCRVVSIQPIDLVALKAGRGRD